MNIIVVDDERYILNGEVDLICRTVPGRVTLRIKPYRVPLNAMLLIRTKP